MDLAEIMSGPRRDHKWTSPRCYGDPDLGVRRQLEGQRVLRAEAEAGELSTVQRASRDAHELEANAISETNRRNAARAPIVPIDRQAGGPPLSSRASGTMRAQNLVSPLAR